jgi:two-component system, LuxR family, response regulator FixJ
MSYDFAIHVVDDDTAILDALCLLLATEGYAVHTHQSARRFLNTIQQDDRGCVVTDMQMPEMSGLDLLAAMNKRGSSMPVIIITASENVPLAVAAMKQGAFDYFKKPFDDDALLASVFAASMRSSTPLACRGS